MVLIRTYRFAATVLVLGMAAIGAEHRDIEFARPGGEPLLLDAMIPEGKGPFPAAILVHGGGWEAGDKRQYIHFLFDPLTRGGIAWFSINYRLAPKHQFPAQAEDTEAAIAWVKANAARFNVDPDQLTLIGESAGGHIASYVAAKRDHGLAGVVSLYGVHDFVSRSMALGAVGRNVTQLLGVEHLNLATAERLRDASPITWVRAGMPPFLMVHGTEDKAVPYSQSVEMCDAMARLVNTCEIYAMKGAPHGMDHWEPDASLHHYKKKVVDWVNAASQRRKLAVTAPKFKFPWTMTDVEFSKPAGVSLKFDAFIPPGAGPHPAVVLVHGGGMVRGNKRMYITPLFEPLAKAGIAWFSIDYRLAPDHKFPSSMDDVRAAVTYVRDHARELRVDPDRIALAGESAGGYVSGYVGARYGEELKLRTVVDLYGVGDYVSRTMTRQQVSDSVKLFIGVSALNSLTIPMIREASPITFVNRTMPPFLFVHGTEDEQVPYDQSIQMCDRMKAVGASCEVFTVEGGRHGMSSWDRIGKPQYKQRIVEWLEQHLRK